jgi:hypothetical protein
MMTRMMNWWKMNTNEMEWNSIMIIIIKLIKDKCVYIINTPPILRYLSAFHVNVQYRKHSKSGGI